ncbi:Cell division protein FtsL [Pontimonas salivibrio]|uniref:Cell division protein FtsL n=1 Tax=Pontimonas salivibrio TaxID=1159327 RepID=A0A2L2BQQ4_9MICO|nr:Cell division protein FtsL [Pontimonas salivibrio]
MSALTAPAAAPPRLKSRPGLKAVSRPAPAAPPKLRYVLGTLLGIFAVLMGQLGLSIALGSGAYEIRDLERQLAERNRDLSIVSEEIGTMQDPQTLAQLAVTLGMVDNADPAYLRLSDSQVIGSGDPARVGGTSLVSVVPGDSNTAALATAQVVSQQAPTQGESLPGFAAMDGDTGKVDVPGDSLTGVEALVPHTPAVAANQPPLGGDLPAPVTR